MNGSETDEISLLDLVLIVAENWLLLVFGPILAVVIAYGALSLQPQTFRSEAIIPVPLSRAAPSIELALAQEPALSAISMSEGEGAGLTISEESSNQSTRLVLDHDEIAAYDALVLLVADVERTGLNDADADPRGVLEERLARLEEADVFRQTAISYLRDGLSSIEAVSAMDADGYSAAVLALDRLYERREVEVGRINDLREEIAATMLAEQPRAQLSGPGRIGRSPLTMALLIGIGVGFVLLVGVFVRAGIRGAARDPDTRLKVEHIRDALLLRRRI